MFHFKNLYPDLYMSSAYRIDYRQLFEDGYRGIIFDIDNTLVPHGAPADRRAVRLFAHLTELGFFCCLISNNGEERVQMFNDEIETFYIYNAHKPRPENYEKAMLMMGTDRSSTVFIGDQIFTDIWGANRAGIFNIMVKKIYWKEEIQIILKRFLEFFVLLAYRFSAKRKKSLDLIRHYTRGRRKQK